MTAGLTIALAQVGQRMGDLSANADAVLAARSAAPEADLVAVPELQIVGYPPEDLVLKPALVERARAELDRLAAATADGGPALLVGLPWAEEERLHNSVALLDGGLIAAVRHKVALPTYGTFDEARLFAPGPLPEPVDFRGCRLGLPICEDAWLPDVPRHLKARGAELLLSVNGSPFEVGKGRRRVAEVAAARVRETGLPCAFLNRVGGQDELVFDGASFALGADGGLLHQLPEWREAVVATRWRSGRDGWVGEVGERHELDPFPADIYHAMVVGLRDYVNANGFPGVVLGLSGGIDSALSAAVAVDALGAERVWCVMMPSRYTSPASLADAEGCANLLGCRLDTVPIEPSVTALEHMLGPSFEGRAPDLTEENIQSRLRAVTLMALSNKFGHMVLTTGNKSEMAVGYATLYGDMAGGYNVLKDAYKMTVFALSRWRNANRTGLGLGPDGPVMPQSVIDKPPSAELREDQRDDQSLPPYPLLDRILRGVIEGEESVDDLVADGIDRALATRIERLVYLAEYKRRQAPPGVKLGPRNFGRDRRYPITNHFRTGR